MGPVRTLLALLVAAYGAFVPVQVCRASGGGEAWTLVGDHAPDHPPVCREHADPPCCPPDEDEGPPPGACCTDTPLDLAPPFCAPALAPPAEVQAPVLLAEEAPASAGARPCLRPERPPGVQGIVLLR